ncbi:hypothetical protein HMPREF0185_00119 [Brevundimonas diminuta 470-4]|nr:hypothetical protein HMPREF0185_00119 [Brevundimonas diminuta 470-4]
MPAAKLIRLIRLGEARTLTRGGDEQGVLEIDFTRIKPMG